jgi:Flp pilus assembly protein TadG
MVCSKSRDRVAPPQTCERAQPVHKVFGRYFASARRAWCNESGAATIEAVIWMPVMIFLFALVADTALVLGGEARVLRVVQDTNRAVSIGRITNVEDAETQVFSRISRIAPHAVVTTTVDSGLITTQVRIPATDLTSVGLVDSFLNLDVMVTAQHLAES